MFGVLQVQSLFYYVSVSIVIYRRFEGFTVFGLSLTLNLLTTTIVAPPSNASKWQMGFNSAFKGLICMQQTSPKLWLLSIDMVSSQTTLKLYQQ